LCRVCHEEGLELNGLNLNQEFVYAGVGECIKAVKNNAETVLLAKKEIGWDINADKTKYMNMLLYIKH
jgi:hypothetical protein